MQTFIAILKVMIALLPMIADMVKSVEAAVPAAGAGKEKLAMVRAALETAFGVINDVQVTFDQVWPTIKATIDGLVALYNKTGSFGK